MYNTYIYTHIITNHAQIHKNTSPYGDIEGLALGLFYSALVSSSVWEFMNAILGPFYQYLPSSAFLDLLFPTDLTALGTPAEVLTILTFSPFLGALGIASAMAMSFQVELVIGFLSLQGRDVHPGLFQSRP